MVRSGRHPHGPSLPRAWLPVFPVLVVLSAIGLGREHVVVVDSRAVRFRLLGFLAAPEEEMIVRPKTPPTVVVELSAEEAAAIVRAIGRAEEPIRAAGNHGVELQRLGALREGLMVALRGAVHHEEVKP